MKKTYIKLQSLLLAILLTAGQMMPGVAAAQELSAPQAPEAPIVSSTPPESPTAPEAPSAPAASSAQTPSDPGQVSGSNQEPAGSNNNTQTEPAMTQQEKDREAQKKTAAEEFIANYNAQNTGAGSTAPSTGVVSNGNNGDTTISTGNAVNGASVATNSNNNINTSAAAPSTGSNNTSGASVINNGNGAGSSNNSTANTNSANVTEQNNSAVIKSNLDQSSVTGTNQSSFNNGSTTLTTGDSNTSGTIMNSVNTNIDGVMVSEFNIADDHKGDIVLTPDAFLANCISGCAGQNLAVNSGNGANSQNSTASNTTTDTAVFQNNDAAVGNSMTLSANSGDNTSSFNTGGNTIINTGDANVSANSLNFVNNNISGNVVFGVVNIYGTLEGDIILPDYTITGFNQGVFAQNTGNGALSQNSTAVTNTNNDAAFQNNDATIVNKLILNGDTGNNSSEFNTNGNTTVKTGQTNAQANVLNVANTNTQNAPVWLVLINEAGKWFGQLLGVPDGQNFAGSDGTRFEIGQDGQISASNNANGAGSVNNTNIENNSTNTTAQNNSADINNTLNLSANTGGNRADFNTGGNNYINTGNANIIANIINFANNNITGNNPLFVTVVNVFDKWIGDFVAPGQKKMEKQTASNNNNPGQEQSTTININTAENAEKSAGHSQERQQEIDYTLTAIAPKKMNAYGIAAAGLTGADENNVYINSWNLASVNTESNKVAGISSSGKDKLLASASLDSNYSKVAGTKAVRINLAWLILLIPAGVMMLIIKRIAGRLNYRKNYYE